MKPALLFLHCLMTALVAVPAQSEDLNTFEIGIKGAVFTAGGEPANDMMGYGIFTRYRVRPKWLIGAGLDSFTYDFERPWKFVGLQQDPAVPTIDGSVDSLNVNIWIERRFRERERGLMYFCTAGLGAGFPDSPDVTGPTDNGGQFHLVTDHGTEFLLTGSLGLRYKFNRLWALELAGVLEHHIADWTVDDLVSGNTGTVDSYTAMGGYFGLSYSF